MNQLYSLAREMTNLTDVQIRILDHMEAALQFAADISKNQIYICAKGKNESVEIVLLAAKPSYSMGNTFFDRIAQCERGYQSGYFPFDRRQYFEQLFPIGKLHVFFAEVQFQLE